MVESDGIIQSESEELQKIIKELIEIMVITVRIIVKVIIVAIFAFVEIAIFANATVPWLEGREANKPKIRVEK